MAGAAGHDAASVLGALADGWTTVYAGPGPGPGDEDRVVVGPGGICVIHARDWAGTVTVVDNVVREDGRPRATDSGACTDAAAVVGEMVGPYASLVVPVLCVVAEEPLLDWAVDVRVCSTSTLLDALAGLPVLLTPAQVAEAVGMLSEEPGADVPEPEPEPATLPVKAPVVVPVKATVPVERVARASAKTSAKAPTESPVVEPSAAERAGDSPKRSRRALLLEVEKAAAGTEQAREPEPAKPSRRPRVRSLVKLLVGAATIAVLVVTGPQIVTSVGAVLSDQWHGTAGESSACAPSPVAKTSTRGAHTKAGAHKARTSAGKATRTKAARRAAARKKRLAARQQRTPPGVSLAC